MTRTDPLLAADEPAPFALDNPDGAGPFVLACEHAGARIPAALGTLGLSGAQLGAHYMVDIGALDLSRALAERLDAPLAHQLYSRMVCDCNRRPDVASFIPETGEGAPVPGNLGLTPAEHARRRAAVWAPFHDGVAGLLDRRASETIFVAIHSFTPVFHGVARPWKAGVLFDRDPAFSPALLRRLKAGLGDEAEGNEPYRMSRKDDYTVPVHGEDRGLPCAEIEIRNDLLRDPDSVARWADLLAAALRGARTDCEKELAR